MGSCGFLVLIPSGVSGLVRQGDLRGTAVPRARRVSARRQKVSLDPCAPASRLGAAIAMPAGGSGSLRGCPGSDAGGTAPPSAGTSRHAVALSEAGLCTRASWQRIRSPVGPVHGVVDGVPCHQMSPLQSAAAAVAMDVDVESQPGAGSASGKSGLPHRHCASTAAAPRRHLASRSRRGSIIAAQ